MYDASMCESFADLIGGWPRDVDDDGRKRTSIATFAADLGIPYSHAQVMRYRNSIAVEFWPAVIAAGERRGKSVTHEALSKMRERRKTAKPRSKAAA
jgi:hypothetical protein